MGHKKASIIKVDLRAHGRDADKLQEMVAASPVGRDAAASSPVNIKLSDIPRNLSDAVDFDTFVQNMREGMGGPSYDYRDIGKHLPDTVTTSKSYLSKYGRSSVALFGQMAQMVTSVKKDPRVLYLGLGSDKVTFDLSPLLDTDFQELIGIENVFISFDQFEVFVREELRGLVKEDSLQFEVVKEDAQAQEGKYRVNFRLLGEKQERVIIGYFGPTFDARTFTPSEIQNEKYNVLITGIDLERDRITALIDQLEKGAGFLSDFSERIPKTGQVFSSVKYVGFDFSDYASEKEDDPNYQLTVGTTRDMYELNITRAESSDTKLPRMYMLLMTQSTLKAILQIDPAAAGSSPAVNGDASSPVDNRGSLVIPLSEGEVEPGSDNQIYGDGTKNSTIFDLNWHYKNSLADQIQSEEDAIVVDFSSGTGAAVHHLLEDLKGQGKTIQRLVVIDINNRLAVQYMHYAREDLKQYEGVVVKQPIEYHILLEDPSKPGAYAKVSVIDDLQADYVILENSIHLYGDYRRNTLIGIQEIMKPGATLLVGSGGIENPNRPDGAILVDTLFELVRNQAFEIIKQDKKYQEIRDDVQSRLIRPRIQAIRKSVFPSIPNIEQIETDLEEAGFSITTNITETILNREEYKTLIVGLKTMSKIFVLPEVKDDQLRQEILDRAYEEVYDSLLKETDGQLRMLFTRINAISTPSTERGVLGNEDLASSPVSPDYGGIDLNPNNLEMQTPGDDREASSPVEQGKDDTPMLVASAPKLSNILDPNLVKMSALVGDRAAGVGFAASSPVREDKPNFGAVAFRVENVQDQATLVKLNTILREVFPVGTRYDSGLVGHVSSIKDLNYRVAVIHDQENRLLGGYEIELIEDNSDRSVVSIWGLLAVASKHRGPIEVDGGTTSYGTELGKHLLRSLIKEGYQRVRFLGIQNEGSKALWSRFGAQPTNVHEIGDPVIDMELDLSTWAKYQEQLDGTSGSGDVVGGAASSPVEIQDRSTDIGGIDFNPNNLEMQTQGNGLNFNLPFHAVDLQNIRIDGFTPVIINVTPLSNLPLLLGLIDEDTDDSENMNYTSKLVPINHKKENYLEVSSLN